MTRPGHAVEDWLLSGSGLLVAIVLYPVLWGAGLLVSNDYWFLPVGVRVAALLRVPARYWWTLLVGEYLGASAMILHHGGNFTLAGSLMANGVPWVLYALAVQVWRRHTGELLPRTPQSFAQLLMVGFAAAALTAVNLLALRWIDGRLAADSVAEQLFGLMVGDFVGLVLLAPVLVQLGDPRAAWRRPQLWKELALSVLPLLLVLTLVGRHQPAALPYVALLALAPPLWLARRGGWRGASLAFALCSTALYFSSRDLLSAQIAPLLQFYLALVGGGGLVLGAWVNFERRLRERLQRGVGELAAANARLQAQTAEMRELGRRLVSAQEDERQRIRADLRGEMSQQISVLATQLSLLVRRVERPELMAMLDGLRTHVQALRDAADDCLENLQPRMLAEAGLLDAISTSPSARALEAAGVQRKLEWQGEPRTLGDVDRMQAYRVAQHLMALALRYSDSVCLELRFALPVDPVSELQLRARLLCRSPLVLEAVRGEPDLQAVRDRMFACGGEALIEIDDGGALQVNCRFDIASSP
jgi:glucose-6-phosphate-specific signal transduction histidine kinase